MKKRPTMTDYTGKDEPNEIIGYIHCAACINELPEGVSPRDYAQLEVGWTKDGVQVWCKRHELNVVRSVVGR